MKVYNKGVTYHLPSDREYNKVTPDMNSFHSLDELHSAHKLHPPVVVLPLQPVSVEVVHILHR